MDFAALKRSSVSFFDIEKPETAFSRWSRARTRAAKVGFDHVFCDLSDMSFVTEVFWI